MAGSESSLNTPSACSQTVSEILNAISVDVEEHFHVSAFEETVDRRGWDSMPSRVERNTERVLDLFDELDVRATFFVLGWVAERRPALVRAIAERGHEVASHGYSHRLIYTQEREPFRQETLRARALLQDASGQPVDGYRAASFSIDGRSLWALDVIADAGFVYDSSIFPVHHDRYGMPGAPRKIYRVRAPGGETLIEVPPATVSVAGLTLAVAGGGYLRLLPTFVSRWAVGRLNRREGMPAVIYTHPWELDPDQPRIPASLPNRFRHYFGLQRTVAKLRDLIGGFRFGTIGRVIAEQRSLSVVEQESEMPVRLTSCT